MTIINSSHVEHAALRADEACGAGTRLIYYVNIGQILARTFTTKDTHSPRGDLIVAFTDKEDGHKECSRRAMGSNALLGFSAPCFTYGTDLILPAEINGQLRAVLRANRDQTQPRAPESEHADDGLEDYLFLMAETHHQYASVHVPEVCSVLQNVVFRYQNYATRL